MLDEAAVIGEAVEAVFVGSYPHSLVAADEHACHARGTYHIT